MDVKIPFFVVVGAPLASTRKTIQFELNAAVPLLHNDNGMTCDAIMGCFVMGFDLIEQFF